MLRLITLLLILFPAYLYPADIDKEIDDLLDKVDSGTIRTVEAFIENLPEELLENWTLMHTSGGQHGSSYASPRAILFGKNAKVIIAFAGSATQRGGLKIDMIRTKTPGHSELREIVFSADSEKHAGRISEKNPEKCVNCHSPPPFRWHNYPFWEGAYGSDDDGLLKDSKEWKDFKTLMEMFDKHPRFKYLKRKNVAQNPFAPYHETTVSRKETGKVDESELRSSDTMPNTRLMFRLMRFAGVENAERMKASKYWKKFGLAYFYYNSLQCQGSKVYDKIRAEVEKEIPAAAFSAACDERFTQITKELKTANSTQIASLESCLNENKNKLSDREIARIALAILFGFESSASRKVYQGNDGFATLDGNDGVTRIGAFIDQNLVQDLIRRFPTLEEYPALSSWTQGLQELYKNGYKPVTLAEAKELDGISLIWQPGLGLRGDGDRPKACERVENLFLNPPKPEPRQQPKGPPSEVGPLEDHDPH